MRVEKARYPLAGVCLTVLTHGAIAYSSLSKGFCNVFFSTCAERQPMFHFGTTPQLCCHIILELAGMATDISSSLGHTFKIIESQ